MIDQNAKGQEPPARQPAEDGKRYAGSRVGKVETCPRLRSTAQVLRNAASRGATTREIGLFTGSVAVHSDLHALRVNGYEIERKTEGRGVDGNAINRYFMRFEPPHLRALLTGRSQPDVITTPPPKSTEVPVGPDPDLGLVGGGVSSDEPDIDFCNDCQKLGPVILCGFALLCLNCAGLEEDGEDEGADAGDDEEDDG